MRLSFLIPTLDRSGAEKQMTLLAVGLKQRTDWDLEVIALTRGGPYQAVLEEQGIPVTVLNKRLKVDPFCWRKLRRHLKQRDPDLLHTWMFTANAYGRLALGKNSRAKIVVSERCVDTWKSGWQKDLDRRLISRTDLLIGNSQPVADFYQELGYPSEKLRVIPNAVEIDRTKGISREKLLQEQRIPEDARLIGYVGRLAKQKRVRNLIWGLKLLSEIREDVCLLIVGDGPEREDLKAFAHEARCDQFVRFLGHREDASQLIGAFDQFWLASEFEGMSNSLMEAMAWGVPCIASDIPANRVLVEQGVTGELFPGDDGLALAQLSDRLLDDEKRSRRLGDAAARRMREQHSLQAMIERYRTLYEECLQSNPKG